MTQNDIMIVQHYDQLGDAVKSEYRSSLETADDIGDLSAILAEFDRIDAGRKAICLS